jgi:hypothetical protein
MNKHRKHLIKLVGAMSGGLQQIAAELIGDAADIKPRAIIKEARELAAVAAQDDEEQSLAGLTGKFGYESDAGRYWVETELGRAWSVRQRVDFLLHLEITEKLKRKGARGGASPAEKGIHYVQNSCGFDVAIELGGHPAGVHALNGHRVLVPVQRLPLVGMAGDASAVIDFVQILLGKSRDPLWETQWIRFVGWVKWWREAMATGLHRPRLFVVFVGPAGCGKSALQGFITKLCGGREANPGPFLSGDTMFNAELWGADHLVLSDATLNERPGVRKQLRDKIKELVANPLYVFHPKGRTMRTLPHRWGVTMSANNDDASATIIPEIDDSTADKFAYLSCFEPLTQFPAQGTPAGDAFWGAINAALPAFALYVDSFVVPANVADPRWGVKAWRHPVITALIERMNPDSELGGVLDTWMATNEAESISVTAADLYAQLDGVHWRTFDKTCRTPQVLGMALQRLASRDGWTGRISSEVVREGENRQPKTVWTLRKTPTASADGPE